ncbi:hypothetical protein ACLOJK_024976 [Asimina triloba]
MKSFLPKIFSSKEKARRKTDDDSLDSSGFKKDEDIQISLSTQTTQELLTELIRTNLNVRKFEESESVTRLGKLNFSHLEPQMSSSSDAHDFRIFVATWNVGGKPPHNGLNLDDVLCVDDRSDIYVLGFQEIVPLNAGNVLVIEDNEPAAKWLSLINQALNKPLPSDTALSPSIPSDCSASYCSQSTKALVSSRDSKSPTSLMFFHKNSLKTVSKKLRAERGRQLKTCNCPPEVEKKFKDSCFRCQQPYGREEDTSSEDEELSNSFMVADISAASSANQSGYSLIASKQMVGIFVTVWVKKELVQHIGHLRLSSVGRGIMGYLGNKGCISVSMSLHQTSFCFVCSHLASGEKEGDELRRNSDVMEILKHTQFQKICKTSRRIPEKILEHDRVIWLGDLNYRIALSYLETRHLLENNDWDTLLEKDQDAFLCNLGVLYAITMPELLSMRDPPAWLKIQREAGRVFSGWKEGKIYFAPTYKYSNNSDAYAGETITSKKKRRTPAWCDRILWHGEGIKQLSYIRGESRFSDHRPVCAVFMVEVGVPDSRSRRGLSNTNMRVGAEELLPPTGSYMALEDM